MKFEMSEVEEKKFIEWWKNHKCNGRYSGAIGGCITYSFTPTSIGVAVSVKCGFPDCNEEVNVTDYDCW